MMLLVTLSMVTGARAEPVAEIPPPIAIDRTWSVLPRPADLEGGARAVVAEAGARMGSWTISVGGVEIDGPWLEALAETAPNEPFLRVVRETSGRAIDLEDFLLFLDDVLVAGDGGRRGERFSVGAGRARASGVFVHPDDVFKNRPRVYGKGKGDTLAVDEPRPQSEYPPAADGDPPGPGWTMRYQNPADRPALYAALAAESPESGYASRIAALLDQLEQQGAQTWLTSTARSRHRGYLMWGAFVLGKAENEAEVDRVVAMLNDRNHAWKLDTPITWKHPDGWQATVQGARQMADTYDVVYATESGARWSKHYGGVAADFVAIGLPRSLTLTAPDGAVRTFDLSAPTHTRDLSLSPELITWIEAHFAMSKLTSDYPHWNDTRG